MKKYILLLIVILLNLASSAQITSIKYGKEQYEVVATQSLTVDAPAATAYHGGTADFSSQLSEMLEAVGLEAATADNFVQVDLYGVGYYYNTNDGWHGADASIEGKTWGSEEKLVCVQP